MKRNNIIFYLSTLLLFFHLFGFQLATNIVIGTMVLEVIFRKNIIENVKLLLRKKNFWVLISAFLIFLISAFYSSNEKEAWTTVELRLSLLLFPIIYGLRPLNPKQYIVVLKFFIGLVSIIPIVGIFTQWGTYVETGDSGWFYNDNIVHFAGKQAVYFAMFINIALVTLFYLWYTEKVQTQIEKISSIAILSMLITSQFLLASRTSLLTSALVITGFVIVLITNKINRKQALVLLGILAIFAAGLTVIFPKVIKRFESVTQFEFQFDNTNPINHYNGEIEKENWNGLNTRLALWTCSIDEFKKRPFFGTGLGDVKDDLVKNYKEKNFIFAIESNYNCHNQYLDILLSNGLIGWFVFLFVLIYLIVKSIKDKNLMLFGVVLIFALACLTENVLSRNQGVILISFILSSTLLNSKIPEKYNS